MLWLMLFAGILPVLFFLSGTNLTYLTVAAFKEKIANDYLGFFSAVFFVFAGATFIYTYVFRIQFDLTRQFETDLSTGKKIQFSHY